MTEFAWQTDGFVDALAEEILVLIKEAALTDRDMAILSEAEKERAMAMAEGAKPAFVTARASLRRSLGMLLEISPKDVPLQQDGSGPVELERVSGYGPYFTVSHTGAADKSYCAVAVSRTIPVGVDIEQPDRDLDWRRLAERRYHAVDQQAIAGLDQRAARQRFFELWTLKEAVLKLERGKLMTYLGETQIDLSGDIPVLMAPTPAGNKEVFMISRYMGDVDLMFGLAAEREGNVRFAFDRPRVPFS